MLLIIIPMIIRSNKRGKARKIAPDIGLHSFQVAPLGRDAYLRLKNDGHPAIIKALEFKKRQDIGIKNHYFDYRLEPQKVYGLLLNAKGKERIAADFEVILHYNDEAGNQYKQVFRVAENMAQQAKLASFA